MSENKRIAKNSLILYINLIISTIIGLYTTRIVLAELGADDYGLYAVVGGIVSMMGVFSTAMLATTFRYIAVELGKGETGNVNKVFNTSLVIHLGLSILFLVIVESVGVWYVKNHLNVSPGKIPDALFVLHFSTVATAIYIASIPFQGLVSAKEKFILRATIGILSSVIKLILILYLLVYVDSKLRTYAVMMAAISVLSSAIYYMYGQIKERQIVKWKLNLLKTEYVEMIQYTGWIFIGTVAYIGVRQGAAVLINLFFGTILNAAFGIATSIYNYTTIFVKNLNQAAIPQIMKSHSSGNSSRSLSLLYFISKYAFLIMLLPSVPIILSIDAILLIWLKEVPEFTKQFTILMILNGLFGVLGSGFDANIQATGKIRKTQIWFSSIMLSTLPVTYALFYLNFPPYTITIVKIAASVISLLVQIGILKQLTEFNSTDYINKTIKPILAVSALVLPQFFLRSLFGQSLFDVVIFSAISVGLTITTIYFVGLGNAEKTVVKDLITKLVKK